jgi:hypothetical protein
MFHGTTIEDLMQIVERAEEHAQTIEQVASVKQADVLPGFFYEMNRQKPTWLGVA